MKRLYSSIICLFIIISSFSQNCAGLGSINFQRWNNISGSAVSNLTSNPNYPNNPSSTGTRTLFEMPTNLGNNLGIRMNGYICPPTTGNYVFWIASDASGELWLSTSSNPTNKVRIAFNTNATKYREWNKYASQKSASISLTAGQVYYVEALMKESTGNDNLSIGWAKPGQSTTTPGEVIPGTSLMRQLPDTQPPTAPTNLSSSNITTTTFTLSWTASTDNVGVTGYDVYQNDAIISTSVTGTSFNVSGLAAGTTYSYYVVARDAAQLSSPNSSTLNVTTNPPDITPPTSPTNLVSSMIEFTSFRLSWTAATDNVGVAGYDIYRNSVKLNGPLVTNTYYDVTGLDSGGTYSMTVIAKDGSGNPSAASSPLGVTTVETIYGSESFQMRTIIANQNMPHDIVYGPDGNIWYTERFAGTVSFVNPATSEKRVVLTLGTAMVQVGGQDGLMGLALHPQFLLGSPYVYISYTYQNISSTVRKTRIQRYTYDFIARTLGSPVTILENIPGSNDHNSARIAIGPDLKIYYSVGDMGAGQYDNINRPNNSQNVNIYEGKILRLNTVPDGSGSWIPTDNPFGNAVYSLGHRNPQGLVWGNVNGTDILYSDEHGPFSDDEVNIIERGRNFGWPNVIGWCDGNYNGRTTGGYTIANELANCVSLNAKEPLRSLFPKNNPPSGGDNMLWPSVGPSGSDFYGSLAIPGWQNSLLVANLKNGTVSRFKLSNDGQNIISETIHYFRGLGRFRDVAVSPDGLKIYVACDASGSTSGPTGGVTTTPANPGSILEFTYQSSGAAKAMNQLLTESKIADDVKDKSIDVYPNPANNYFIVYNYIAENRQIQLYDINGKLARTLQTKELATRVDINGLSNGIYVLVVRDNNGKNIRTEKIMVLR